MAKANYNDAETRNAEGEWNRSGSEDNDAFTRDLMAAVDVDTGQTGFETAQNLRTLAWLMGPESPVGMALGGGLAWLPFAPEVAVVGEWVGTLAELGTTGEATTEQLPQLRPTWRRSEDDVGRDLGPTARAQVSYKDRDEVPQGTTGSVRPDFSIDNVVTVEVKNDDIETNAAALIRTVANQAIQRAEHLPAGMQQRVIIDIRGQSVSESRQEEIVESIVSRAKGSLNPISIRFKEDN